MPQTDHTARLHSLVELDVGALMSYVTDEIRAAMNEGNSGSAEYYLSEWERFLGGGATNLVARIRDLARMTGYRPARDAFRIPRQYRRGAFKRLQVAIRDHDKNAIDRWAWVAQAYRCELELFVANRQLARENTLGLEQAKARIRDGLAERHGVLARLLKYLYGRCSAMSTPDVEFERHVIGRVNEIASRIEEAGARDAAALTECNSAKIAARAVGLPQEVETEIGHLPTVALQIHALRAHVREAEHRARLEDVRRRGEHLEAELKLLELALGPSGGL